jgi:hypothetical protein
MALLQTATFSLRKKTPLGYNLGPLILSCFKKLHRNLDDVEDGIDAGASGHDVSMDEVLAVKECQQHLFGLAGMDFGLNYCVRLALLNCNWTNLG